MQNPRNVRNQSGEYGIMYCVLPDGGTVTVDLTGASGNFVVEWFNPQTGLASNAGAVAGGAVRTLSAPFVGHAAVFIHNGAGPQQPPWSRVPLH